MVPCAPFEANHVILSVLVGPCPKIWGHTSHAQHDRFCIIHMRSHSHGFDSHHDILAGEP